MFKYKVLSSCVFSSGVTTAPATPAMQGGGTLGGGILPNLQFFKRKIFWQSSKMYHISANLAFGRREKIFGGTKSCRGQEAYKKNRKKSGDLFFFFVCGGGKKWVGGHQMAYVTPLCVQYRFLLNALAYVK